MTLYFRRRLLFRVLALLMMFLILALVSVVPIMQASALAPVIAYGAKELVAALLIAGGASFATSDEAREAATKVWDWLGQNAADTAGKIEQLIQQQIEISDSISSAIRISDSTWDVLARAFNILFTGSPGDLVLGQTYILSDEASYQDFRSAVNIGDIDWSTYLISRVQSGNYTYYVDKQFFNAGDTVHVYYRYLDGSPYAGVTVKCEQSGYIYLYPGTPKYGYGGWNLVCLWEYSDGGTAGWKELSVPYTSAGTSFYSDSLAAPDLVYPGEDTMIYVPDIPEVQTDEEGKDIVIWPDLSLNPDDFVLDIPKTATGDLVDVPYDTLVDASTGTAVGEGEGTGTGEGEGTGSGILDILGDIWDAIRNFFDSPSDFKLDFDGFKNLILVDRFPFCIPFDLRDAIMLFAASAADYRFSIDLDTAYFSVHHTVDLSPYTVPITFFRYVVVVWFVYVLILRTRDVMKW